MNLERITDVFSNDDLYLVFNYTDTLEKLYQIDSKRICHIHGYVRNPNDTLIMGHDSIKHMEYAERKLMQARTVFADCVASVYECELEYLKATHKQVNTIIQLHKDFIQNAELADEIHVIGCSLSKADRPYFDRPIGNGQRKWVFYYYEKDFHELKKKAINLNIDSSIQQFAPIECIKL